LEQNIHGYSYIDNGNLQYNETHSREELLLTNNSHSAM